jgi:VWFA-related protein
VVTDATGRPLTFLTEKDFQIFEDGVPQEIRYFAAAETPRSVLLLFDVTGVMESQGPFMVQGMNVFLATLRPKDRVSVAAFGPEFEMLMSFRGLEPGKPVNIKLPKTRMGTKLYDALNYGAKKFDKETGRKAILTITDGRESYFHEQTKELGDILTLTQDSDFQKRLKDAAKQAVPLYFIALDTDPRYLGGYDYEYAFLKNPKDYMRTDQYLRGRRSPTIAEDYLKAVRLRMEKLAEVTGGFVVYPKSMQEVVGMYEQIGRELGFAYSLGYTPKTPNDGKYHSIEVRVTGNGIKVRQSRDGYGTK